jgi:hypothetical protein
MLAKDKRSSLFWLSVDGEERSCIGLTPGQVAEHIGRKNSDLVVAQVPENKVKRHLVILSA